jgi:hypothetical protein
MVKTESCPLNFYQAENIKPEILTEGTRSGDYVRV